MQTVCTYKPGNCSQLMQPGYVFSVLTIEVLVRHGPNHFSSVYQLKGGEFDSAYVKSCRIRAGRSVKGLCLPPAMSRAERRVVEKVVSDALNGLGGDLKGQYYPLSGMADDVMERLIDVGHVIEYCDQYQLAQIDYLLIEQSIILVYLSWDGGWGLVTKTKAYIRYMAPNHYVENKLLLKIKGKLIIRNDVG